MLRRLVMIELVIAAGVIVVGVMLFVMYWGYQFDTRLFWNRRLTEVARTQSARFEHTPTITP